MESSTSPASFYFFSQEQAHQQHIRHHFQQQQLQKQQNNGHYLSHHPVAAHALAAAHSTQLLSPTPVSPVTFPSQLVFGAANSRSLAASGLTITPSASPSLYQRSRQASEITMPDTPRLSIDSAASEILFNPATPPLSLGSTNTPTMAHALLTPVGEHGWSLEEPSCGTISPMEIQLPGTPLDMNTNCEMQVYANPIIVPSNASPAPSVMSNKQCPALTPSASQASSVEADYCDPRNLTYPSPGQMDSSEFGIEFPTMPTLCGADDEHRLLLGNELMSFKTEEKGVKAYGIDFMEELSDLDSEDDFIRDIASLSDVQSNNFNKRAKLETFDESEGCSSDDDSDQLMSPPMSTTTSRQGSETPSEANESELMHKSPKKVKTEDDDSEDDDDDMSEEQKIRSFKFGSQCSSRREGGCKQNGIPINPNVIRRGRKQSLTDDPTKTFVCHLCNRRFRRQEHLKRHFRSLHTEDKPFSCGECGKKFSRSDNLTQHARIHGQGAILLGVLDENEIIDRQFGLQDHEQQPLELVVVDALQAASGSKDSKMMDDKRNRRNKRKRIDE